jgi:hypothetical protein
MHSTKVLVLPTPCGICTFQGTVRLLLLHLHFYSSPTSSSTVSEDTSASKDRPYVLSNLQMWALVEEVGQSADVCLLFELRWDLI